jgi:hypothetical protein
LLFLLINLSSRLATYLALKLEQASDLILGQHTALLGPHERIDPDLICLRGSHFLYSLPDSLFVIPFGPYCAFEPLPRLAQASPGGNYFILAVAPYLLQSESLVGSKPDSPHQTLLELLSLYSIVLGLAAIISLADLWIEHSRVQWAALTGREPVRIDPPLG